VGVPGSASYDNGTYAISGSGGNAVYSISDSLYYVYQSLNGDGQIVAHLAAVQYTNQYAEAGLMLRETLEPNSNFVSLAGLANGETCMDGRTTIGEAGGANQTCVYNAAVPQWLKLVRTGNTFSSYVSSDGMIWNRVNSLTLAVGSNLYAGLEVSSYNSEKLNTSTFDNISVGGVAASSFVVAGNEQNAVIHSAFGTQFKVSATDGKGNPVANTSVIFSAPASTSSASGVFVDTRCNTTTATTDANGVAVAPYFVANGVIGNYNITASFGGVATTFNLANTTNNLPTLYPIAGAYQLTAINTTFNTPFQALVVDANNNPLSGINVTFSVPSDGGGVNAASTTKLKARASAQGPAGTFAGADFVTVTTDANGIATAPSFTANSIGGSYMVIASAPNIYGTANFTLVNTTAPVSFTSSGGDPQFAPINTQFINPLQARVKDANGYPVTGLTVSFTVLPNSDGNGASGNFVDNGAANIDVVTDGNGVATALFQANGFAGTYTVEAALMAVLIAYLQRSSI
jgi:hypothetical protein